jgi:hypothetical protein
MEREWRYIIQEVKILDMNWFVKPKVFIDGLYGGDVSPLAQHHPGRIAREDIEQDKHYGDHPQQNQKAIP